MTGHDLIEALERTGTGKGKLAWARRELERRPTLTAGELAEAMAEAAKDRTSKIGELTVAKAKRLAAGEPVAAFLGVPPKNAEEAKIKTLAQEMGAAFAEQVYTRQRDAQEQGIALPARPKK